MLVGSSQIIKDYPVVPPMIMQQQKQHREQHQQETNNHFSDFPLVMTHINNDMGISTHDDSNYQSQQMGSR